MAFIAVREIAGVKVTKSTPYLFFAVLARIVHEPAWGECFGSRGW
jgi:hypothetical protein